MTHAEDRLRQWLRDAQAMEQQGEQMLTLQVSRLENYPELRARFEAHLKQTRRQAERLARCVERFGGEPFILDESAPQLGAIRQGLGGIFAGDEVINGLLASYTFEQLEIASYRILIAAVGEVADLETLRICEQNLLEEQAMAFWLDENIEPFTREYLQREEMCLQEHER